MISEIKLTKVKPVLGAWKSVGSYFEVLPVSELSPLA